MEFPESSGNVFLDLGFPEEEAEDLLRRSEHMRRILEYIRHHGLDQTAAATRLGLSPSEVSALLQGHIDRLTTTRLAAAMKSAQLATPHTPRSSSDLPPGGTDPDDGGA